MLIPAGSTVVNVPAGYSFVVDDSNGANLTITGGQNLLGGSGDIVFSNIPGPSTDIITAGDGTDSISLAAGSSYDAALGNGADTFSAAGTGTLQGGSGFNVFAISAGADTILAGAGSLDSVSGGNGATDFVAGTNSQALIEGGTGGTTIMGAANGAVFYSNTSGPNVPSTLLVAGAGNETLWAANATGTELLYADRASGGADSLVGGAGVNAFVPGTGNDTMLAASLNNVFYFVNGQAGGADVIQDFGGNDMLALVGYDTVAGSAPDGAAQTALHGAIATSAGVTLTLPDRTTITFAGLTSTDQLAQHIVSS